MLDTADLAYMSDPGARARRRRILLVSDSVGTPYHRRGIFHYTTHLIEALVRCGHEVTLLLEKPPASLLSARAQDQLASLSPIAGANAQLGAIYAYLSNPARSTSTAALAKQYLCGGFVRRHFSQETVRNGVANIAYLPGELDHLKGISAFLLAPSVYSSALVHALCGLRAPAVDARGFDTVVIDTPTHLRIEAAAGTEIVAVIHDLIMLSEASVNERWLRIVTHKLLTTVNQASNLVFVSQSTKETFHSLFPGFADRPAGVLSPSLSASFASEPSADDPVAAARSDTPAAHKIVAILADEPRKNLATLLEAFALLGEAYHLLVLGQVRPVPSKASVSYLGYVSRSTKRQLLSDSMGIVVPSFAEGFGIPLIEGGGLGRPVFCSDIPVFREIGGDGPFYFNPYDAASIAAAIAGYCEAPMLHGERLARMRCSILERFGFDAFVDMVAQHFGGRFPGDRIR